MIAFNGTVVSVSISWTSISFFICASDRLLPRATVFSLHRILAGVCVFALRLQPENCVCVCVQLTIQIMTVVAKRLAGLQSNEIDNSVWDGSYPEHPDDVVLRTVSGLLWCKV